MGHAMLERVRMLGTQSADYITASGHSGRIVIDHSSTWLASVNSAYLGEYLDRESALARVEAALAHDMEMVLHDWELYQSAKREQTEA